ncbi:hypothetical protein M9Y10_011550 [Tritrichomonas musculus]|uniref:Uncharacterized protein n=1 Tax=Tritrichomonas musculus TaxID=1915356 RepID=A0ABR2IKT4_9EUKA
MKTNIQQPQNNPTLKDYETIFSSSEDALDFTNTISNLFPDYIRNKKIDTNVFSDHKISNQNNSNTNDGSEFQKELNSQISFLCNLKQTLDPYSKDKNSNKPTIDSNLDNPDSNQTKLSPFVKVDVVDAIVDSIVISTLIPFTSGELKNSRFIYDTITSKKISSISKEIIDSDKVQKLVQKRIFLLSIGKLRPTPEEAEKRKKRFIPASKLNIKSILKNPIPQGNTHLISNADVTKDKNDFDDNSKSNEKADLSNHPPKNSSRRVHFIPEKGDTIPANAVVFDYKESAKLMKKTREEEKAIRRREEEFMKKVKNDFISKQKTTKNKYFSSTPSSTYDYSIALKPKPKPRSRSAKAKPSKPKTTNPSSSLYPSYYSPKTKSSVISNSIDKDDRIRRKVPLRSPSPQVSFRSQYDENSNVMRKGKSSGLKEKPKTKPKSKQTRPKPRTGHEY